MSCQSAYSIYDYVRIRCDQDAVWQVNWSGRGIHGRMLGPYERKLCEGCMEPWLSRIRPADNIHYVRLDTDKK